MRSFLLFLLSAVAAGGAAVLTGCSPHVGSHCNVNTDCSLQGTLVCDTSQPNGYCTNFNCAPDSCQNEAACVLLGPSVPGCPYSDYQSPSRAGRSICLQQCHKNSDCRTSEGYVCADPRQPPWNALILDDVQSQLVCIVPPDYVPPNADAGDASMTVSPVCQVNGPTVPPIDAGVTYFPDAATLADAAGDAAGEAAVDAESDGPVEAASDAGLPESDGGSDAGLDAPADATTDAGGDAGGE